MDVEKIDVGLAGHLGEQNRRDKSGPPDGHMEAKQAQGRGINGEWGGGGGMGKVGQRDDQKKKGGKRRRDRQPKFTKENSGRETGMKETPTRKKASL